MSELATQSRGLTILGCSMSCGKTVFATGLGAMLKRQLPVRVVKPIYSVPHRLANTPPGPQAIRASQAEQSFISTITCTPVDYDTFFVGSPARLFEHQWQSALESSRQPDTVTIVETCGAIATPIYIYRSPAQSQPILTDPGKPCDFIYDPCQFALAADYPVVLVSAHDDTTLESLIMAHGMATGRGLSVAGLVSVECEAGQGRVFERKYSRMDVELTLQERTGTAYLGCIKHSQAIDVEQVIQGNLIKMTEGGLDLLHLFKKLAL